MSDVLERFIMMTLKEQHDKLLAEKPEGAVHDADGCPICNPNLELDSDGGGDMSKTYTEEEFTAAVQEAVAPIATEAEAKVAELQAEINGLKATIAQTEVAGHVAELQAELDKAEIRVAEAQAKYDELVAYLGAEAAAAEETARREALRDSRRAAVREASRLTDDYIESRLDSWVDLDEAAFESMLEDWKSVASASSETASENNELVRETAMSNVRDDSHEAGVSVADLFNARNHGIDIRYL